MFTHGFHYQVFFNYIAGFIIGTKNKGQTSFMSLLFNEKKAEPERCLRKVCKRQAQWRWPCFCFVRWIRASRGSAEQSSEKVPFLF